MRRIVATILALHMLAHGAFGCCLHHGHTWSVECCHVGTLESRAPEAGHDCCHRHHHDGHADLGQQASEEHPAPFDEPQHDSCAKCVFQAPAIGNACRAVAEQQSQALPLLLIGDHSLFAGIAPATDAGRPPTLRAHLLLSVMLL